MNFNLSKIDQLFKQVSEVRKLEADDVSGLHKLSKLMEEAGELSAELLKEDGYKFSKDSLETVRLNQKQEAVDCLIQIFDLLQFLKLDSEEILKIGSKKVKKWEKNVQKRNKRVA